MAAGNKTLGQFELSGIAPAPRGIPQIEVTFDIDSNGIVSVKATDKGTGKAQSITITASTNLSDADIEKAVKDAEMYAEEDKKRKELVETKNGADQLIFAVEKFVSENGEKLTEEDKKVLQDATAKAKEDINTDDIEAIKKAVEELSSVSNPIFTKLYQQEGAQGADGTTAEGFDQEPDIH